jgi:LDH2 family malate/lactate/ureidoglycolate dehydrogenase
MSFLASLFRYSKCSRMISCSSGLASSMKVARGGRITQSHSLTGPIIHQNVGTGGLTEDSRNVGARLVRIEDLRRCLATAFERLQLPRKDAEALAGLLLDSELRDHRDHGVAALGLLTTLYREGKLNPRPRVRVLSETDGAILLDGDRGCGPSAPTRAVRWCIERAHERKGMAVAAVRDWQFLVGAPYARLAAEAGLIGFACTNFTPLVAPPGGRTAVFGTNPVAYAIPAGRHPPVVLDIATTVTAMQKVRLAAQQGDPMPEGVIFDREGRPATDPRDCSRVD